jgi:hypothetical protein
MTTWPVVVDAWQQECCGKPFGVGDVVTWNLVLLPGEHAEPDSVEVVVTGRREAHASAGGAMVIVRTPEGPEVGIDTDPADRRDAYRGRLHEEHHGGEPSGLVPTTGTVRRIRVNDRDLERIPESFGHAPGALVQLELSG